MSELITIKNRLRDSDKIIHLLESVGCEYINVEQGGELVTAMLPRKFDSGNKRSVQVKINKYLSCNIRSRSDFEGDIFALVSYIHFDKRGDGVNKNLPKSKEYICKVFGWKDIHSSSGLVVKDYTMSLREILGGREKKSPPKVNKVLDESIMNQFYFYGKPLPFKGWVDEGISRKTQIHYGVGFDLSSKRVVFPLKNRLGQIVGVKGRIMKDEDDLERKYLYLYRCNNRYEWFNFHNAYEHILKEKVVYIYEAEKSCMKAFDFKIYNTLAIGSSDISMEQIGILKSLGDDIKVVLCYDKGVETSEIKEQADNMGLKSVYAMIDMDDLLSGKNSPIDEGIETWNKLVENNIYEIS